ncbi:MAG TPA: type I 3-dehydroquinate dehydratase [Aquifex aeolicus]|uniref:3-dehydroquinate dehydratase n=1 Tax=Aquifex aeolicus TaxID=63363 RepID=A0A9D0YNE7_AQUAO|nr:type I 3-dehydroquinate dehydratase [Aquifex aeolicus]HIQ26167.1 type I 3-dehydroquinate dehydratase [Aquifex aeolicus]
MKKTFLIAVSLTDENYRETVAKAKRLGADAIEYRIDGFKNRDLNHCREVISFGNSLGLKAILTIRAKWEGGIGEVPNRVDYYTALTPLVDFVDIELRTSVEEKEEIRRLVKNGCKKLIVSFHNFEKTPSEGELKEIFAQIVEEGADIAKVACLAQNEEDVARLLCVASKQPIPTVAIAMGEKGKISRVAGFVFNSVITYCALDKVFAPGQLTIKEMVELRKKLFGF